MLAIGVLLSAFAQSPPAAFPAAQQKAEAVRILGGRSISPDKTPLPSSWALTREAPNWILSASSRAAHPPPPPTQPRSQAATPTTNTDNRAVGAPDKLLLDLPSNQWFEGPLELVSVSPDGNWVLVKRLNGQPKLQLYSLKTGQPDQLSLIADLNRIDSAVFCGPWDSLSFGGLARLGERTVEDGWFLPHRDGIRLSPLPANAIPICARDSNELAYYRSDAPDQSVFINVNGRFRDYGIAGRVTAMAFSPDGNYFYGLLFLPSGQSTLIRIDANTGQSRVIATRLDASPQPERISISPDGKKLYLALATDSAPNNLARQNPEASRWLKIYSLDLTTGARKDLVDTPGEDNNAPTVAGTNLYWVRTVYNDSIALVPSIGGPVKQLASGSELPMWSPDSHRIGYFFGGKRLADYALDLDDAVVSIDAQGNRASDPAVIVSGYGEDFSPAWSPDGKWIAFHSHRSPVPTPQYGDPNSTDDIYLRRADDVHASEIRLTDFGWETGPAYWSPDGKKLLFNSWDRNGQPGIDKLWVLTLDPETGRVIDTTKLPLPDAIRSAAWAAWSPDGTQIAVEDNRGGENRSLWIVNADGSHAQKVLDYKGSTYDGLDWMPDGASIVYSALKDGRMQLFAIPKIGGVAHQLTTDSGNLFHPRVSPDGKWIACTRIVQSKQILRRKLN
jgi:Tol biopolymer transport system component